MGIIPLWDFLVSKILWSTKPLLKIFVEHLIFSLFSPLQAHWEWDPPLLHPKPDPLCTPLLFSLLPADSE